MADVIYNSLKSKLFSGEITLLTDSIKVMLVTSLYVPDQSNHVYKSSVTNEVSGTNYTAGGAALANKTLTIDSANNKAVFDADDVTWPLSTITARGAVIYKDTGVASTSPLICYIDFGQDQISSYSDFIITWNSLGILNLTDGSQLTLTGSLIEAKGGSVASAATTNIWTADGNTIHITGTTAITSFGTAPQAGAWKKIIFDGVLTLTHGANLNLPGSANITVAAGDMAYVFAETTTQFRVIFFDMSGNIKMNGKSIWEAKGASVASATDCNIWAADGNTRHITGTTNISAMNGAPQAGAWMKVIFDGSLVLVNSANLILPGSANITVAAGDMAFVFAETTTQFRVIFFDSSGNIKMNGKSIWEAKGGAVASAANCNIWVPDGNTRHITGATAITSFGTAPQAGAWMRCIADGALPLVHSATIDLPGSANITCAAGDTFEVYAETTTTFKVRNFTRQDGKAVQATTQTLSMFATLIIDSSATIAANTENSINIGTTGQSHKFYLVSAYTNTAATKVVYGASVSPAEAVNADVHVFISRDSADAQERLKIVNGSNSQVTVFYKVYQITE